MPASAIRVSPKRLIDQARSFSARVVGVYRFWRDFGFALGALIAGIGADAASSAAAIVAALTAASGLAVALTNWQQRPAVPALGISPST